LTSTFQTKKIFLKKPWKLFKALNDERNKLLKTGRVHRKHLGRLQIVSATPCSTPSSGKPLTLFFEKGNCDALELTSFPYPTHLALWTRKMSLLKALRKSPDLLKSLRESKNLPSGSALWSLPEAKSQNALGTCCLRVQG
jgi:hypothetical protein